MKFLKTYESYINSDKGVNLDINSGRLDTETIYHWTDYRGLMGILNGDEMFSSRGYISFTVSESFNYMQQPVRISFDFQSMKNEFDFETFDHSDTTKHENEVRISQNHIHGISKFVTKVELYITIYHEEYKDGIIDMLSNKNPNIPFEKKGKL